MTNLTPEPCTFSSMKCLLTNALIRNTKLKNIGRSTMSSDPPSGGKPGVNAQASRFSTTDAATTTNNNGGAANQVWRGNEAMTTRTSSSSTQGRSSSGGVASFLWGTHYQTAS